MRNLSKFFKRGFVKKVSVPILCLLLIMGAVGLHAAQKTWEDFDGVAPDPAEPTSEGSSVALDASTKVELEAGVIQAKQQTFSDPNAGTPPVDMAAEYDAGTYNAAEIESMAGSSYGIQLKRAPNGGYYTYGTYTSSVLDAVGFDWTTMSWNEGGGLANGVVGLWHMNEASGIVLADSSSYVKDLALTNFVDTSDLAGNGAGTSGWCSDDVKLNNSLKFDGDDDYATVSDQTNLEFGTTGDFTISFWAKTLSDFSANKGAVGKTSAGGDGYYVAYWADGSIQFGVVTDTSNYERVATSTGTFDDQQWHYITAVRSGSGTWISIYTDGEINGVPVSTATRQTDTSKAFEIGRLANYNGWYFHGLIDEVAIYNRALLASEISTLYNGGSGQEISPVKLQVRTGMDAVDIENQSFAGPISTGDYYTVSGTSLASVTNSVVLTDDFIQYRIYFESNRSSTGQFSSTSFVSETGSPAGTVDVTNGSAAVGGNSSPNWSSWVNVDDLFSVDDGTTWYTIASVADASLTLSVNYTGSTLYGNTYDIKRTTTDSVTAAYGDGTYLNTEWAADYVRLLDAANDGTYDASSGTYTSPVLTASADMDVSWDEFNWSEEYGYGDEISAAGSLVPISSGDSGLVGLWHMDGTVGSIADGAIVSAMVGSNGTVSNTDGSGMAYASGKLNQAISFDGTDDYVDIGNAGSGIKTIEFWIKATNPASVKIIDIDGTDYIETDASGDILAASFPATTAIYVDGVTGTRITANNWHHVVITTDDAVGLTASAMDIGRVSSGYFDGLIDEVAVYSSVLTANEIIQHYSGGLVGLWHMNIADYTDIGDPDDGGVDDPNKVVADSSGFGNDGSIICLAGGGYSTAAEMWNAGSGKFGSASGNNRNALGFDGGTDDYVNFSTGPASVKTVEFWVKPTTTTEYFVNLTGISDYIWANSGTVTAAGFTSPTIYVNGAVSSTITAGAWQHIAVTTATAENASNLEIGRTQNSVTYNLAGFIDEVALWNRVLTAAEITDHYMRGILTMTAEYEAVKDDLTTTGWVELDSSSVNALSSIVGETFQYRFTLNNNSNTTYTPELRNIEVKAAYYPLSGATVESAAISNVTEIKNLTLVEGDGDANEETTYLFSKGSSVWERWTGSAWSNCGATCGETQGNYDSDLDAEALAAYFSTPGSFYWRAILNGSTTDPTDQKKLDSLSINTIKALGGSPAVNALSDIAGANTSYTISFTTSDIGALSDGNTIEVTFDGEYDLTGTLNVTATTPSIAGTTADDSGTKLVITLGGSGEVIGNSTGASFTVSGIVNPTNSTSTIDALTIETKDSLSNIVDRKTGIAATDIVAAALSSFVLTGVTTSVTANDSNNVTVTAYDQYSNVKANYIGIIVFTSTDAQATAGSGLPSNYTFLAGDSGVKTFTGGITLKTVGSQTFTVTDPAPNPDISIISDPITVGHASAVSLTVTSLSNVTAGTAQDVIITAYDAYSNIATGYTGTVTFTSTDPEADLPSNYAFLVGDSGAHTFTNGVRFRSAGSQTVTATDTVTGSITGTSSAITVTAAELTGTIDVTPALSGSSNLIGYTGDASFTFSLPSNMYIPDDGKIIVTFSGGSTGAFSFNDGGTTAATSGDLDGSLAVSSSGEVVTITRNGSSNSGTGPITVSLSYVKNPGTALGTTGTYSIQIQNGEVTPKAMCEKTGIAGDAIMGFLFSAPVLNETWAAGSTGNTIMWSSAGVSAPYEVYYSCTSGWCIITSSASGTSTTWDVPANLTITSSEQIKILEAANPTTKYAVSYNFNISGGLEIETPTTASNWAIDTAHTIQWKEFGSFSQGVKLEFLDSGGTWRAVTGGGVDDAGITGTTVSSNGDGSVSKSFSWTPSGETSYITSGYTTANIRVSDAKVSNPDSSDDVGVTPGGNFTIASLSVNYTPPDRTLTAVNVGAVSQTIKWNHVGASHVKLKYYSNASSSYVDITTPTSAVALTAGATSTGSWTTPSGSYSWTVPDDVSTSSSNVYIKAIAVGSAGTEASSGIEGSLSDALDSAFVIYGSLSTPQPTTATTYNGTSYETDTSTDRVPITWTSSTSIGSIIFEYTPSRTSPSYTQITSTQGDFYTDAIGGTAISLGGASSDTMDLTSLAVANWNSSTGAGSIYWQPSVTGTYFYLRLRDANDSDTVSILAGAGDHFSVTGISIDSLSAASPYTYNQGPVTVSGSAPGASTIKLCYAASSGDAANVCPAGTTIGTDSDPFSIDWTIPDAIGSTVYLRAENTTTTSIYTTSGPYIIKGAVSLSSSSGVWIVGETTREVTGTVTGSISHVTLYYRIDGGTWAVLDGTDSSPYVPVTSDSFTHTLSVVPDSISTNVQFYAKDATSGRPAAALAESSATTANQLTIRGKLTITTPSSDWYASDSGTVNWAATGTIGNINVTYQSRLNSSDTTWSTAGTVVSNTASSAGSYAWSDIADVVLAEVGTLAAAQSDYDVQMRLIVTDADDSNVSATSSAFTVKYRAITWHIIDLNGNAIDLLNITDSATTTPAKALWEVTDNTFNGLNTVRYYPDNSDTGTDSVYTTQFSRSESGTNYSITQTWRAGSNKIIDVTMDTAATASLNFNVTIDANYDAENDAIDMVVWVTQKGLLIENDPADTTDLSAISVIVYYDSSNSGELAGSISVDAQGIFSGITYDPSAGLDSTTTYTIKAIVTHKSNDYTGATAFVVPSSFTYEVKLGTFYNTANDSLKANVWLERSGYTLQDPGDLTFTVYDSDGASVNSQAFDGYDSTSDTTYVSILDNGVYSGIEWDPSAGLTAAAIYSVKAQVAYHGKTYNTIVSFNKGQIGEVATNVSALQNSVFSVTTTIGSVTDLATANTVFGKLLAQASTLATTNADVTSILADTASVLQDTSGTILNRSTIVKSGDIVPIRYRTATGLSPKIKVYSPTNVVKVNNAAMREIGTSGIYSYSVTFAQSWGEGDFTVQCTESTLGSAGAITISVVNYDLEDISDISDSVSSIMASVSDIDDIGDTADTLNEQIGIIEDALGKISSDTVAAMTEKIGSKLSAIELMYEQLSIISEQVEGMSNDNDLNLEKILEVSKEKKEDITYLKNKTQELKAMMELNTRMVDNMANEPMTQIWYEYRSVVLKALIVNPSKDHTRTIPFKAHLPQEAKPQHIMTKTDLEVAYDTQKGRYYVFGTFELAPGETKEVEVEMEDIWFIEDTQIESFRTEAQKAFELLKDSEYKDRAEFLMASVENILDEIMDRQKIKPPDPKEHISKHRENLKLLEEAREELKNIKSLSKQTRPIPLKMTWKLIVYIVVFLGILGGGFLFIWQRKASLTEEPAAEEGTSETQENQEEEGDQEEEEQ